jgi:DNA-binding NtrC family response regulator
MAEYEEILVVEDDALVSEVIAAALEDSYRITVVETSDAALSRLRGGGIQLLLLDCTLPGGVDPNLLPEADRAGTHVVLMSGDPGRAAKLSDRERPFILKPFSLGGLVDLVESVLKAG